MERCSKGVNGEEGKTVNGNNMWSLKEEGRFKIKWGFGEKMNKCVKDMGMVWG